jgi:hypothetical protein
MVAAADDAGILLLAAGSIMASSSMPSHRGKEQRTKLTR